MGNLSGLGIKNELAKVRIPSVLSINSGQQKPRITKVDVFGEVAN